ncbi:hypothetical protein BD309DRAFT_484043 [Dichomitus squalens]|nr:hypothetical protein BD309DRAFT_484043 [Dichomitus squalens]
MVLTSLVVLLQAACSEDLVVCIWRPSRSSWQQLIATAVGQAHGRVASYELLRAICINVCRTRSCRAHSNLRRCGCCGSYLGVKFGAGTHLGVDVVR